MEPKASFEKIGRQDSEVHNFLDSGSDRKKTYLEPKQYIETAIMNTKGFDLDKFWRFCQKRKWLGVAIGVSFLLLLLIVFVARGGGKEGTNPQEFLLSIAEVLPTTESNNASKNEIKVHIVGAVKNPGVYSVEAGSRVNDLIRLAGGASAIAYADALNLASKVNDGDKICVPIRIQQSSTAEIDGCEVHLQSQTSSTGGGGILNINTAGAGDLESLAGIGPSLAQAIISYRQEQGDFQSVDELRNISGITQNVIDKFKDQVSIQ